MGGGDTWRIDMDQGVAWAGSARMEQRGGDGMQEEKVVRETEAHARESS